MSEPTTLRAGDSIAWTVTHADYAPADGWSLTYRLLFPAGTAVDIPSTGSGTDYSVAIGYTATAAWPAGNAVLVARVERGAERITIGQQSVTIEPDLLAATSYDGRSWARRALDAARAAVVAYTTNGQAHVESYDIAGRTMKFRRIEEIQDLIAYLESEIARERAAAALLAGGVPGRVYYRG